MGSLVKAIYDNWRSFVSFLLTFVVIGVLLVYEPTWISAVTQFARALKEGAIEFASFLGWDTLAAAFDFTGTRIDTCFKIHLVFFKFNFTVV